jgi:glycosyltransferase involved in cell wall biosynthesis
VPDESLLARIYSCADVFVLPSLEDNLPNTVLEAMSCGVPVAGFDVGGMPDMVENGRTGKLACPESVEGLVDAMAWILSRNAAGIFAGECRRKSETEYALPVQAERYRRLYLKAVPGVAGSSSGAFSTGSPLERTSSSP